MKKPPAGWARTRAPLSRPAISESLGERLATVLEFVARLDMTIDKDRSTGSTTVAL